MITAGFVLFLLYLIFSLSSVILSIRFIWRGDFESLSAPVVLFFSCIIGLSCNLPAFVRCFAGLYGISLAG